MKRRSVTRKTTNGRRRKNDEQLREFERRDLGGDIRQSGVARVVRRRTRATSILLEDDLMAALRKEGRETLVPRSYQTMLKMIVREHLDEY